MCIGGKFAALGALGRPENCLVATGSLTLSCAMRCVTIGEVAEGSPHWTQWLDHTAIFIHRPSLLSLIRLEGDQPKFLTAHGDAEIPQKNSQPKNSRRPYREDVFGLGEVPVPRGLPGAIRPRPRRSQAGMVPLSL